MLNNGESREMYNIKCFLVIFLFRLVLRFGTLSNISPFQKFSLTQNNKLEYVVFYDLPKQWLFGVSDLTKLIVVPSKCFKLYEYKPKMFLTKSFDSRCFVEGLSFRINHV